ncbi:MAG TPA: NADH-quinone oxidoreductase subunit NuoG [Steroidobacteraceae bacterium]
MSDDQVNIEVDGVALKAKKGAMIMQVTDAAGIYIPRFCYHEKLSVAANCRMCLVEVEKAPKPAPACATPVMEGMKVFTRSPRAISAQKATMEFLLINHPLDCPICDQGGECELQDLAMGFGRDVSRFNERKRVVKDKNIGPLVSTDMTRCIQCTRCVRFGEEIAGIQELGTTGRGEWMEIGTFIERSVDHELSGNIIDLCPVGALNNKPFRYRARAWEMTQHALVSPHDGVGSNLFAHSLRGQLMRVVPRHNEAINETWISDRDRFSYEGIYAEDRLTSPLIRRGDSWQSIEWESALEQVAVALRDISTRHGPDAIGALASPSCTVEELYLLQKLMRGLECPNLDHRLRQRDFRDASSDPILPSLGVAIADVEQLQSVLIIGSNLRREVPLLAHRIRKAAVKGGARVAFLNPRRYDYFFPIAGYAVAEGAQMVDSLAALVAATADQAGKSVPANVAAIAGSANVTAEHRAIAAALTSGERRAIWLGALAMRHPAYADLRQLAAALADLSGARLGYLAEGANAAGAHLAGVLPHRGVGGAALSTPGLDIRQMLASTLKAYVLVGALDVDEDLGSEHAAQTLRGAECVIALTPYMSEAVARNATLLLPIGTFAETSGTYVNLEGRWQSFAGAAKPVGECRPGWKVLRVLGNLLNLPGFDYDTSEAVRDEVRTLSRDARADSAFAASRKLNGTRPAGGAIDVPMYGIDPIVRRAPALQRTREAQQAAAATGRTG